MPYADPDKQAAYNREYQRAHYHKIKDKIRARRSTPEHKKRERERMARYRENNRHKIKARNAVASAIRKGILEKQPCESCGCLDVQAHHDNYNKPLEVRWLCRKCHDQEHGKTVY